MNCEQVKKISAGYLEDAIPSQYRLEVEEHLSECPVCSFLMEQMKLLKQKIRQCVCDNDCCPKELREQIVKRLTEDTE